MSLSETANERKVGDLRVKVTSTDMLSPFHHQVKDKTITEALNVSEVDEEAPKIIQNRLCVSGQRVLAF